MLPSVAEIEHQADDQPSAQPQPVGPPEAVDHRAAHDNAKRGNHLYRGYGEASLQVRPPPAQNQTPAAPHQKPERLAKLVIPPTMASGIEGPNPHPNTKTHH